MHLARRDGFLGKQEDVRTPGLAAADNQRQLELADLCDQAGVIKRILVNVNASPNAGVICTDGNDAQAWLNTL